MTSDEHHVFIMWDDKVMSKQIQATHVPGGPQINVKRLLKVIHSMLNDHDPETCRNRLETFEAKSRDGNEIGSFQALARNINKICYQISWKCSSGCDAHTITMALLNSLSSYSWDAKVVLSLAAFAVNISEFGLLSMLLNTNQLARAIAFLQLLPYMLNEEDEVIVGHRMEARRILIKAMFDVTKCIMQFNELPTMNMNSNTPVMIEAWSQIRIAVYWTIRCVVAGSYQSLCLMGLNHWYRTPNLEAWELCSLIHRLNNIRSKLTEQHDLCHQQISLSLQRKDEERGIRGRIRGEARMNPIDNLKTLSALIYAHNDILPLYDGSTKKRVHIDTLKDKIVLLLISDLEISHEELSILNKMYLKSLEDAKRTTTEISYEIIWVPMVDRSTPWKEENQKKFETLQLMMPWHSVHHPLLLDEEGINHIKNEWHFMQNPIMVMLDQAGRAKNLNALHMMAIWGNRAFPFSSKKEDALWKEESWRLEFLVDEIDQKLLKWIKTGRLVCLYGGEDMNWIRKFTQAINSISKTVRTPIKLVYMGKSKPEERVERNKVLILKGKLSYTLKYLSTIWFFWFRLENMWYSKMKLGKTVENDSIMQEIKTMLSFGSSDQGWAVIGKGPSELVAAKGETILMSFAQIDQWKENVKPKGFVTALNDHLHQLMPYHINRIILSRSISEIMLCGESIKIERVY